MADLYDDLSVADLYERNEDVTDPDEEVDGGEFDPFRQCDDDVFLTK